MEEFKSCWGHIIINTKALQVENLDFVSLFKKIVPLKSHSWCRHVFLKKNQKWFVNVNIFTLFFFAKQ